MRGCSHVCLGFEYNAVCTSGKHLVMTGAPSECMSMHTRQLIRSHGSARDTGTCYAVLLPKQKHHRPQVSGQRQRGTVTSEKVA